MTNVITLFLSAHFTHRKPSAAKVERLIKKEGWVVNHPKAEEVLEKWSPPTKLTTETGKAVLKSVCSQKWKGLAIKDFGGEKGKGKKI